VLKWGAVISRAKMGCKLQENICRLPVPISRSPRDTEATQREVGEYWPETRHEEMNQAPLPSCTWSLPVKIPVDHTLRSTLRFLRRGKFDFVSYAERPTKIFNHNSCLFIIIIIIFLKGKACFLFLDSQDEVGPSISS